MKLDSIALRLTLWYALLSAVLIAVAGCGMYWMLSDRLQREDDAFLSSKIAEARAVLGLHPGDYAALREELQHEGETFPDIHVRVLDGKENLAAESSDAGGEGIPSQVFDAMDWADLKPGHGVNWRSHDHIRYRLMSENAGGLVIHAAMRLTKEQRLLNYYRDVLAVVVIVVLVLAFGAGYAIARYGLLPARQLAAIVDGLGVAQLNQRVGDAPWPAELRQLAENFDLLLARLDDAFGRISRFSADIAHELRTPLHILRSEAEMVLSRQSSLTEYRDNLASAMDEYNRMSRMVDALLFLARAEQPDILLERRRLDARTELESVRDFFQAMADELGVVLTVRAQGDIWADDGLLRRALGNLVDNALRYTPAGGQIMLEAGTNRDGETEIAVIDNGSGVSTEELPRLTDRFYTIDRARQRRGQGAGLGLSIVQSIVRMHGGGLRLTSQAGAGMTAILHFPPAPEIARPTA